jgi:hypothetical protein
MPGMSRQPECPICSKPAVAAHAPFCSQGCRDRDLLNWLDERYAVPARPSADEVD